MMPPSLDALIAIPAKKSRLWLSLGWLDIVQSYRRNVLGPLWITVNLVIFTFAMTLVYGALFGTPTKEYAAYLMCGMIAWYWVSALLSEVGSVFLGYSYFIKSTSLNKGYFVWATVYKQLLIFLHHLIVVMGFVMLNIIPVNLYTLQIVPVIALVFLLSIPITAMAGILFARYRDLQRLLNSASIIVMMITPIMWKADQLKGWRVAVIDYNPAYYIIEIIRAPLLGMPLDMRVVAVVVTMTAAAWLIGAPFFRRYERYVVFWL
jgi:ABC-type polysaccharide/polyol phosphate export permease